MTFQEAVKNTDLLRQGYRTELRAIKKADCKKIVYADEKKLEGSVDIDSCTQCKYPNSNRWDYAIGYAGSIYFLEVHPARTSEVKVVVAKLKWLKGWLAQEGFRLNETKGEIHFNWVASRKINILKTSPEYRMAQQKNLLPSSELRLD